MRIRLEVERRQGAVLTALVLVLCLGGLLQPETIVQTATYPSPGGIYRDLATTNGTLLARDGGRVVIGAASPSGTATLEVVNGYMRIADGTQGSGKVLVSDANGVGQWQSLGGTFPSGMVLYFNTAACPAGWTDLSEPTAGIARGRHLLGIQPGHVVGQYTTFPNSGLMWSTDTDWIPKTGALFSEGGALLKGSPNHRFATGTAGPSADAGCVGFNAARAVSTNILIESARESARPIIQLRVCRKT